MNKIIIGISEGSKYFNYEKWIKEETGVEIIKLSYPQNNFNDIQKCNGIILTGGHDINPRLYNQPEFLSYCNPNDIDEKRDEFEWQILQHIEETQKPLLGICRGLQLANVFYGGTLIPDIPAFGKFNHSKIAETKDREHMIIVDTNSALYKIIGEEKGVINSGHHQSIDMPGFGLVANAMSPDGIIEGLERKDADGRAFMLLVQWHPERMLNQQSAFSKSIKESFLNAVRNTN